MRGILFGFLGLFSGIMITTLIYFNYLSGFIGLIIIDIIGIIVALNLILDELMSGGMTGTLTNARLRGNPIAIILRNDKAIRFVEAKLREGLAETRRYGRFIIIPDSVYSLPNGVTAFLAYHKYGVSLHPSFVQATTRLREAGLKDIEEIENLNETAKKNNKEVVIHLDAPTIRANIKTTTDEQNEHV